MKSYRAVCLSCDHTTLASANVATIPTVETGRGKSTNGVYRSANGAMCLNCAECGEPKHAVPN